MNLILEIIEPGRAPRRLSLSKSLAIVGRSSHCDVQLAADSVSSRHARIRQYQDHVVIEDLGSTNGLLINGERISGPVLVSDGDEIQVGTNGPILSVVAGAGVSSASVRSAANANDKRPANSYAGRGILIASTLFGMMLFLAAGGAAIWWLADIGRDRLEISSITDPRLSQAVGMVICGADRLVDGEACEDLWGSGTAFIVSSDGFLVTNKHVVEGFNGDVEGCKSALIKSAKKEHPEEQHDVAIANITNFCSPMKRPRVWVVLDGEIIDVEVKMISDNYDLAVLKVDRKELPYFALSTNEVDRLTEVSAMGFPGAATDPFSIDDAVYKKLREYTGKGIRRFFKPSDLEFTQTQGKVSKRAEEASANNTGKTAWIQHTASISQGNSGGPLCLNNGVVTGINTRGSRKDGNMKFSFSVPQIREELEAVTGKLSWR